MVGARLGPLAVVVAGFFPAAHADPLPAVRQGSRDVAARTAGTNPATTANEASGDLKGALAARFRAMEAAGQGIFNEDVSSLVAPAFPPGLTFDAARETARRNGFGPLTPFKGHGDPGMTVTYVAELDLSDSGLSDVFVAVYLAFAQDGDAKAAGDLVLRRTDAYLRASGM